MVNAPLRVVTHRNWLAKQFAPFGGVQDFGFDISPATALGTVWWAPGEWVARAASTNIPLELVSCGTEWVPRMGIPDYWLKREIVTVAAGDAVSVAGNLAGDTIFVKLPEAKTDAFPAALVFKNHLGSLLASPLISENTVVQLSEEIQFSCEARFFVAHSRVVAHSWYQNNGLVWVDEGFVGGTTYEMAVLTEAPLPVRESKLAATWGGAKNPFPWGISVVSQKSRMSERNCPARVSTGLSSVPATRMRSAGWSGTSAVVIPGTATPAITGAGAATACGVTCVPS